MSESKSNLELLRSRRIQYFSKNSQIMPEAIHESSAIKSIVPAKIEEINKEELKGENKKEDEKSNMIKRNKYTISQKLQFLDASKGLSDSSSKAWNSLIGKWRKKMRDSAKNDQTDIEAIGLVNLTLKR